MLRVLGGILFGTDVAARGGRYAYLAHAAPLRAINRAYAQAPRWLIWIAVALVAAVLLPLVGTVAAVAAEYAGVTEPNFALRAIYTIFPEGAPTALSLAVGVLSGALAAAVAAVASWQIAKLLFVASEHGEIEWSAPGILRFAIFFGLLVPGATGLSAGHHVARQALVWSNELATEIAANYAESVLVTRADSPTVTAGFGADQQDLGGLELVRQVVESEVCGILVAWTNQTLYRTGGGEEWGSNPALPHPPIPPAAGEVSAKNSYTKDRYWRWGRYGNCGLIGLSEPIGDRYTASVGQQAEIDYRNARIAAVTALIAGVRATGTPELLASTLYTGDAHWPDAFVGPLLPLAHTYDRAVARAASTYLSRQESDTRQQIVAGIRAHGWPAVGTLWSTLSSASARALALASEAPVRRAPDAELPRDAPQYAGFARVFAGAWARENRSPEITGNLLSAGADSQSGTLAKILNPVTRPLTNALIDIGKSDSNDPLRGLVGLGHYVTGLAEAGVAAGAVAGGALGLGLTSGLAVFDWAASFARPVIWLVFGVGWVHAYLLPMLPFVAIVFAFLSFILSLIELLIAIPVLCFLGARLDGPELFHTVLRPGLILVLNAVFRPVLVVLAFAAALLVLPVPFWVVDGLFSAGWQGAQGGYTSGIGGVVGAVAFLTWLHWQIAIRVIGMISEAPDRVLAYLGGAASDGATEARNTNVAAGVFMSGGNSIGRRVSPSGGGKPPGGGGGGDEPPGIRPLVAEAGGSAHPSSASAGAPVGGGGGGNQPWFRASGNLSSAQQASAQKSYAKFAAANPDGAAALGGLDGYIAYAQAKEAKRRGDGG